MYGAPVGTITITTSTQIVPTTNHARIFDINFLTSGTSGSVYVYNNGSAGTLVLQAQATSSVPGQVDFGFHGHEFSNGLYILLDAKTLQATVSYRQEEKNT